MKVDRIYGLTGNTSIDGFLTLEQRHQLDTIQENTANKCLEYLANRQKGELFPSIAMATGIGKGKIIHKIIEGQVRQKRDSKILLIAGTKIILVEQSHKALMQYIESEDDDEIISETTEIELDSESEFDQGSFLYKTGKIGSET